MFYLCNGQVKVNNMFKILFWHLGILELHLYSIENVFFIVLKILEIIKLTTDHYDQIGHL